MAVINSIADREDELRAWRRLLHQNPELGYEEVFTSNFVAEKLAGFGLEVHRGMGKTGVVGILHGTGTGTGTGTSSGKAIGLRADMDALPMDEMNDFAHASQNPGRMHACGHDGHTTMLLGAAQYLAETRNFDGTVYFIFQPAEEGGGGGKAMIKDGLFEKFNMQSVWGLHNWPGMEAGEFGVHSGACMAAADMFDMEIIGAGGHAAIPHLAVDPVPCGAAIVQSLQTIVSRRVSPTDAGVVTVTIFQAGSAHNVIPGTARLAGTARSFSPEVRELLANSIREICTTTAAAYGCELKFNWEDGYPATVNHAPNAARAADIVADLVGESRVDRNMAPSMGAEDFSYMLEERPGAYIWLGTGPAASDGMLHNAKYDFNDDMLTLGTSYWAKLVESELPK